MIESLALLSRQTRPSKSHTNKADRKPEILRREIGYRSTHLTHGCLQPYQRLSRFRSAIAQGQLDKTIIKTIAFVIALRNQEASQ
jgi:hypothetical protein